MTGKTHKTIGVCVGIAFAYWRVKTYGDSMFVIGTISSAVGAMIPDIDHNSSKLGSYRKTVIDSAAMIISTLFGFVVVAFGAMLAVSGLYNELIIISLLIILPIYVLTLLARRPFIRNTVKFFKKHRGIMHTLAAPLLLYLGHTLITNATVRYGLLAMTAGYMSHLILDCMTKRGCPILWPIIPKNISFLHKK